MSNDAFLSFPKTETEVLDVFNENKIQANSLDKVKKSKKKMQNEEEYAIVIWTGPRGFVFSRVELIGYSILPRELAKYLVCLCDKNRNWKYRADDFIID